MRKSLKGIIAGAVLLGSSVSSTALAEDLLQVYELALTNDPVFQAGFHEHEAAKEIYSQAKALLLPTVKLDYSTTDTSVTINKSDNPAFDRTEDEYTADNLTLSLTQSLYSFSNWAYFKQSKEDVKRVAAELEDVKQDLFMRVSEGYFSVLREYDNYRSIKAEVASLEKHYELVSQKREDGLARVTDELDANARFMQAKAREVEIRNQLKDALQGLKEITGQVPNTLVGLGLHMDLVEPTPAFSDEWVEKSRASNPMVIAKRHAIAVAWQEVRRQKGGHYPTLDLVYTTNERVTTGSVFDGANDIDTEDLLIKLTVPIYAGGAVSSKVRESVELHNKAQDELQIEWRKAERETYAAFDGVVGSISKVEALQNSVDSYELGVEAKRTAYESGLTSSLSVLDAERDLFFARTEFSSARYDYLINTLRLKRSVGMLTIDDLKQVNGMLSGKEQTFEITARVMDSRTYRTNNQAVR